MEKIKPMLLESTDKAFDSNEYYFEFKFDGLRMIADLRQSPLLYNRNMNDRTLNYPFLIEELKSLPRGIVLDGEVIAVDSEGKQNFYKALENDLSKTYKANTTVQNYFMAFDLIYYENKNISHYPLFERKNLLTNNLSKSLKFIKPVDYFQGIGNILYKTAQNENLEGIVAKRINSQYLEGSRSKDWLKIKCARFIEAYICAFFIKSRPVLCLGIENGGKYTYIGNVGNGLAETEWNKLYSKLNQLRTGVNPFSDYSDSIINYVRPEIRLSVKYLEQKPDGKLRQPVIDKLLNIKL